MPIRKTKMGFTATYGGVTKNFKTRNAAEKWSAKYKDTNRDAPALKELASILTGSKRKAKRTSKRGKRRLYT
jgi:hypothetical protein